MVDDFDPSKLPKFSFIRLDIALFGIWLVIYAGSAHLALPARWTRALRTGDRVRVRLLAPRAVVLSPDVPALHLAARYNHPGLVTDLIALGFDLDRPDYILGFTPLHTACRWRSVAAARALLAHGAAVDPVNSQGLTPLIFAAKAGALPLVRELLARGANPNHRTAAGWTPLMFAVRDPHPYAVKLLLQAGADPYLTAPDGDSAITIARRFRLFGILAILASHQSPPRALSPSFERMVPQP